MTVSELCSMTDSLFNVSTDFEHNIAMVKSDFRVVDFDRVKDSYAKAFHGYAPRSCDGLYLSPDDNIIYLFEFKNGKITNEIVTQIYFKILESLSILSDITEKPTSFFRSRCVFILIYNDAKNRSRISSHVARRAGREIVRYGLDKFERIYLKKVHTINANDFHKQFVCQWEKCDKQLKFVL